jgi:hypothetical protein
MEDVGRRMQREQVERGLARLAGFDPPEIGAELRRDLEDGCWGVGERGNPIEHVLPVGYDSTITDDVHAVLRLLNDERALFYDKIADRLGRDKLYVHLILEVLADRGFTEYGTSPRGSWLTEEGEQLLALADAWKRSLHPHAQGPIPAKS